MRARQVVKRLETSHLEGLSHTELFLATEDLLPVTDEKKTWDAWNFVSLLIWSSVGECGALLIRTSQVGFWIADSFNLNTFVIASSMISSGLNWWQGKCHNIHHRLTFQPFFAL